MAKTRTFIAIEATDEVHARAMSMIDTLSPLASNVRWVRPDTLHWTLQFLGDVDDVTIYEICREVSRAAVANPPFDLHAKAVNAFPSIEKPRTIWLGAGQGSESLCTLQDEIEERMAKLGFRPDRQRYIPHLTIGRVNRGSHAGAEISHRLANLADYDGGIMAVDEVLVYSSELTREGPNYHVLGRASLESRD